MINPGRIFACPSCSCLLDTFNNSSNEIVLYCGECNCNYHFEDGVPNLLPPHLRNNSTNSFPEMSEESVKGYYIETERYDWVTDTKYPEKLFHVLRERAIVHNIKKQANGDIGLDMGCGTGLITRHINLKYTVGLDINRWAISKAISHVGKSVQFVLGDAENLPLADDTFDIVVCTDVLEHLLRPDKAAANIFRVLKPGGILVGTVPSKSLVWKYRKMITTTCPASEPFHNNYSKNEIKELLHNFEIIQIRNGALGLEWSFTVRKPAPGNK